MCLIHKDLRPVEHVTNDVAGAVVPLVRFESIRCSVVLDSSEVGVPVVCCVPVFALESTVDCNHALIEVVNIASGVRVAIRRFGIIVWLQGPYPSESLDGRVPYDQRRVAFDT